jgi:hypothetical protein
MKTTGFLFVLLFLLLAWQRIGTAEIRKTEIPDVAMTPSLNSVISLKDSVMPKKEVVAVATTGVNSNGTSPSTNGYTLPGSSIIVDNPVEPKCVFYGNYNEGSGDAFQYLDVNTIVFECQ